MASVLPLYVRDRFSRLREGRGLLVVLTGAGISAESGIPTFRGREGYWVVGAREYQPQEMATWGMFQRDPAAVWAWYLYRRGVCRRASPNAGHQAIEGLERRLHDHFCLITQNVDGLHLRAGNSPARTYQIHGNIDFARCAGDCHPELWPLPMSLGMDLSRASCLTDEQLAQLRCPRCHGWARPHVLWFDECYDEARFRLDSSLDAATAAELLLIVGTSGATSLPQAIVRRAVGAGALIVDINVELNPFSAVAEATGGAFLQGPSAQILPSLLSEVGLAVDGPT
jgi:NAD-dependent deacetylase